MTLLTTWWVGVVVLAAVITAVGMIDVALCYIDDERTFGPNYESLTRDAIQFVGLLGWVALILAILPTVIGWIVTVLFL